MIKLLLVFTIYVSISSITHAFEPVKVKDLQARRVKCDEVLIFFNELNLQLSFENQLKVNCFESKREKRKSSSDIVYTKTHLTLVNNNKKDFCKKTIKNYQNEFIELDGVRAIALGTWQHNSSTHGADILKDHNFKSKGTRKYLFHIQFPLCSTEPNN